MNEPCPQCAQYGMIVACRHVDGELLAFVGYVDGAARPWLWVVTPWALEGDYQARGGYAATKEEALAIIDAPPAFERD